MRILLIAVGKPGRLLQDAIAEYELRAARYWTFEAIEVKEEKGRAGDEERVRDAEGERILQRTGTGMDIIALTRTGEPMHSKQLARYLERIAVEGRAGVAFVIGGAFGLSGNVLQKATRTLQLSSFTMPHDLARLMLAEQVYRAGTIARGEPYHKGAE